MAQIDFSELLQIITIYGFTIGRKPQKRYLMLNPIESYPMEPI